MKLHGEQVGTGDRAAAPIHDGTGDTVTWFDTAPRLVDLGYRLLMPDLRGHGSSLRSELPTRGIRHALDGVFATLKGRI